MSNDILFLATIRALDAMFSALDLPALDAELPEDSELAHPERTTLTLENGEVIEVDVYQLSEDFWTAKDAHQDRRTGWDSTREKALLDLQRLCEDDMEDCDVEEP